MKFGFRPEKGRIPDSGRLEVTFRTLGNRARIAVIPLTRSRVRGVTR